MGLPRCAACGSPSWSARSRNTGRSGSSSAIGRAALSAATSTTSLGSAPTGSRLVVGDVLGPGAAGGLIGHLVARIAGRLASQPASSAGSVLAGVNRELMTLGLDDLPLVAMLIGIIDYSTGQLELARAGLPAPLYLPSTAARPSAGPSPARSSEPATPRSQPTVRFFARATGS